LPCSSRSPSPARAPRVSFGTASGAAICEPGEVVIGGGALIMSLDSSVRMLHAAPPGFDASTLEIWGPLLNGGLCVLHDEDIPTAAGLARTVRAAGGRARRNGRRRRAAERPPGAQADRPEADTPLRADPAGRRARRAERPAAAAAARARRDRRARRRLRRGVDRARTPTFKTASIAT